MPIPDYAEVGPQVTQDASVTAARAGKGGDQIVGMLQARYYEQAYRGNTFMASNQSAATWSVALATTYTGLYVANPLGNSRNLVLLGYGISLTAAPAAAASLHLIGGFSATSNLTYGGALIPSNLMLGNGQQSTAKAGAGSATIVSPGYLLPLTGAFTAGALPSSPLVWCDLSGQVVLPPGAWAAIGALTAVAGLGAISWAEVPV